MTKRGRPPKAKIEREQCSDDPTKLTGREVVEIDPIRLTPREIDEKCLAEGVPVRHAGWEDLPDTTADSVWPLGLAAVFYAWRDLARTREQCDRLRVWGRELWRDSTDEAQYMPLIHAEQFLRADLAAGIVRAFGYKMDVNGHDFSKEPIPHDVWRQFPLGIRSDLGVAGNADRALYSGVTVLRHEVVPLLIAEIRTTVAGPVAEPEMRGRPDEPAPKRGGGRPTVHDWAGAAGFAARDIIENDYPASADDLARKIKDWFQQERTKAPAFRELQSFAAEVLRTHQGG